MKPKVFISILFSSVLLICNGQTTPPAQTDKCPQTDSWKMQRWDIGVNVNTVEPVTEAGFDYIDGGQTRLFNPTDLSHQKDKSSSLGLNISYKIRENCALRLSAKRINYKIDETVNFKEIVPYASSDYLIDDAHFRQSVINISPGILWDYNYKKLNFYCGFQLHYKKYSTIDFQIRYTDYLTSNNTIQDITTHDFKQHGGFSIGAGPVAGFAVNLYNGILLGAEFSTAYSYYKTGGERTNKTTFSSGTIDSSSEQNSYETFKFSSIVSSINISYNF